MTLFPDLSDLPDLVVTGAAPAVLDSGDIHVRWVMPEIFHDLPVQAQDDDEAVRLLEELADRALLGAGEEDKTAFAVMCALGLDDLRAAGVEYAGVCVTAVAEAPCTATVSAMLVESPDADDLPGVVRAISSSLRGAGDDEVSEIELPCGAALLCVGSQESEVSGQFAASGEPLTISSGYIRVFVPLPNATTVVMEMQTPTMTGWDIFSTMFGNIVSSLRLFSADGTPLITTGAEA